MAAAVIIQLPPLVQGEEFGLQVVAPTGVNLNTTPPTLYLDPPVGSQQVRLTLNTPSIEADGSSATFREAPSWSAAMDDGAWDLWVAVGDNSNRDAWVQGVLPVVAPRSGPLA